MTLLIEEHLLYHPDNNRYAIYRLLSNSSSDKSTQWGVVSRSGILNTDDTIRAGLVSGKTYSVKNVALKRLHVLLQSAIRRGFINYKYQVKYSYSQDWSDMINNLEKRKTKKSASPNRPCVENKQNGDQYILEIIT